MQPVAQPLLEAGAAVCSPERAHLAMAGQAVRARRSARWHGRPLPLPNVVLLPAAGQVTTDLFHEYWGAVGKDGMAPSTHGYISVEESVAGLLARIEELTPESSGEFRRQSGESIPW